MTNFLIAYVVYLKSLVKSAVLDLKPNNPVVEEGDTLVLNCTFTATYNETRNASWLAFKHNRNRYGPEYVSVLSDDMAQLRLPNVTIEHYGHFVCFMLPNKSLGLSANQDVTVASEYIIRFCVMCSYVKLLVRCNVFISKRFLLLIVLIYCVFS